MMRSTKFLLALLLCVGWIILLAIPWGKLPAIGTFFHPELGFWANAAPENEPHENDRWPPELRARHIQIRWDYRRVPHIVAGNENDLYFAQGYLHARDRLWQMDMQTRAAAGRISEIIGAEALHFDRLQRRKGMVWAAENSLHAMRSDPRTAAMLSQYTAGVNTFIKTLNARRLPLEYKLMNFYPEAWTDLKSALLLKLMADDLTGHSDDIALSYLRAQFPDSVMHQLFPNFDPDSNPVIPQGTSFPAPTLKPATRPPGRLFADFSRPLPNQTAGSNATSAGGASSGKGSNSWALASEKTLTGGSILCNDPHLSLRLPSIWYELQLSAPGINCYGVSIPGAPGIVIGFNDSISWGMTNNYRDVKDYYELLSDRPGYYLFDHRETPFRYRLESIAIKGRSKAFVDTVAYSIHGPVIYDKSFPEPTGSKKMLAMAWMAHRGTNELLAIYLLNRADGYPKFVRAIAHFKCPAQNFLYSDRHGNIAVWGQGLFMNNWPEQGRYVMRGDISATLWGDTIPQRDNPHVFNPPQAFLETANQQVTDTGYPYAYGGDFTELRSWEIYRHLRQQSHFTVREMKALQNNNRSFLAAQLLPFYYRYGRNYKTQHATFFQDWDGTFNAMTETGTAFQLWWHFLYDNIWKDDIRIPGTALYPTETTTMGLLLNDTSCRFVDDRQTAVRETLAMLAKRSFEQAWDSLARLKATRGTHWFEARNTSIRHLTKLLPFSFTKIKTGGHGHAINAMKSDHGPSWRMIVAMSPEAIEAWGVYPGGQSGNPGSPFYASFLPHWIAGKYYRIEFDHYDPGDMPQP